MGKSIREVANEHGLDLSRVRDQGDVLDVITGKRMHDEILPESPTWTDEKNQRRCDLIEKEGLTPAEGRELCKLQKEIGENRPFLLS